MTEEVVTTVTEEEEMATAVAAPPTSVHELKPKMKVNGKVQRLELYGAIIDLGLEATAILHVSQLGKDRVNRVADALSIGEEISVWVDKVDADKGQITVSMIEPLAVEWGDLKEGQSHTGKVIRLEKFGAFIDIGAEKEGLVHVSELSHEFVKHPSEALRVGDEVQVKVLGFNKRKRRIDLSIKALLEAPESAGATAVEIIEYEDDVDENEPMLTAMEIAMREAMHAAGDPLPQRGGNAARRRQQNKIRARQDEILRRTLKSARES
jgi:small subunit ribosomal protein S1